jgi:hypothetical protein
MCKTINAGDIMKRSRLNLFKVTSMTISLLGILMIVATIAIFAYIGFEGVSSKVTSNVDTGSAYDQLAALKSEYSSLNNQYSTIKVQASKSANTKVRNDSVDTELQLVKAQSAITDVESALSTNQPQDVVNDRLDAATTQLRKVKTSLGTLTGEI